MLTDRQDMSKKTSLRRSAETKLTTEDLIHPHEASNLPGLVNIIHIFLSQLFNIIKSVKLIYIASYL